jgi:hypothetical protein
MSIAEEVARDLAHDLVVAEQRIKQLEHYNSQCVIITEQDCSTMAELNRRIATLEAENKALRERLARFTANLDIDWAMESGQ